MAQGNLRAKLSYTEMFNVDELTVEFDGVTYTLAGDGNGKYGAGSDPGSANPIGIIYANGVNTMYIDKGFGNRDHHVVIKSKSSSIETTECFKKAVRSVGGGVMMLNLIEGDNFHIEGATWQEAHDALTNGAMIYLMVGLKSRNIIPCVSFDEVSIAFSYTSVNDAVHTDTYIWEQSGTVLHKTNTYPPQGN